MKTFFQRYKMPKKKSKSSSTETIYLKFEYDEAINSKRDALFFQASLVNIAKIIREYKKLRKEELKLKSQLYNKLKKLKTSINRINKSFPKVKTPSFLEEEEEPKKKSKGKKKKEEKPKVSSDLEKELQKIQRKIQELNSK